MNFELILNAVAGATNFAAAIAKLVDEAGEVFSSSERDQVQAAVDRLAAQNEALKDNILRKLEG